MEEWKEVKLGDILNFRRGHDLPKTEMHDGNIPVAGSNGIIGYHDIATPITPCITIGRSGNIGTPYIYDKCWAHNTVLYIDDFKGNYPLYLFYLLKTLPISSFSGGSAVPTLNRNHIHPLIIKHTSNIQLQKKIASILKSLDDKIQNNKKINENLEQQAQALFKSWFVDFEPFRDQPFVESELGMIPEGWRVGVLNELVYFINGYPFKSESFVSKGRYKVITIKSVQDGNLSTNNTSYIDELPLNLKKECILSLGDILLSLTGNVGRCCLVDENNLLLNQRVAKIVPTQISSNSYVYAYFRRMDTQQSLISIARGTAQANLSPIETGNLKVIIPPKQIIDNYSTIVSKLLLNIIELKLENSKLSHLRDILLPRLMSGELSVK